MKDNFINGLQKTKAQKDAFIKLKRVYTNDNLTSFVRNSNSLERIIEHKHHLYQKIDPIYLDATHPFIKAHFYAPEKNIFGKKIDTFWANIIVIWLFNLMLYITLHYRLLRKLVEYMPKRKISSSKLEKNE